MTGAGERGAASGAWRPAAVAVAGFIALPFGRPGRPFLVADPALHAWSIGSPLLWVVLAGALAALGFSLLRLPAATRADLVLVAGTVAFGAGVAWLVVTATPFGPGALVSLCALAVVLGHALSESGRVRGDAFLASAIVLVSLLVVLFIVYPLYTVLRAAVIVDGSLDLSQFRRTVTHPRFFSLGDAGAAAVPALTDPAGAARRSGAWFGRAGPAAPVLPWAIAGSLLAGGWAALWRGGAAAVAVRLGAGGALGLAAGVLVHGRGALPTSLLTAAIVAPACTMLGLGFAILGQRGRFAPVRRSLDVIGVLPIITPPFLLAFAMIFLLGRRGVVTHELLGLSTGWIFGVPGVALTQILAFTPVAYLLLRGAVASLNPALDDAAQTLGAGRWTTLRTVTWPLLRPALAAAFLLSVIESLADFGNPLILGGERNFLATEVYLSLTGRFNPHEAAVYGVVLLALVLAAFAAQRRWLGGASFITVTGRPAAGGLVPLPGPVEAVLLAGLVIWTLVVAALYASIVVGSVTELWGVNYAVTLRHYRDFMGAGWPVFLYTARVAALSAVPAMLLGLLVAYLVSRQRFRGRRFLEFGALLSFATPGTVMGVAYVFAFNTGPWLLTASAAIIVLALVFRNMPVAIRAGVAGLAQIDPTLEEASTVLRARSFTTLRRVVLPLLFSTLVTGLIFAFVSAMTAVSQVIFLVSPGNQLATVLLLGWVEQGQLGRAAAMGTVLIVTMLVSILAVLALARRIDARAPGARA